MKKELLEEIIRLCVREVLDIVPVVGGDLFEAETVGAPAPPAGGQGTADQPPVPDAEAIPDETPPLSPDAKGIFFVNPKKQLKPEPKVLQQLPDANLERELYKMASMVVGPRVRVAANTLRSVKNQQQNPALAVFLYVGKQDPESEELYLLADKTYQGARANSIGAHAQTQHDPTALQTQEPDSAQAYAAHAQSGGKTQAPEIDEVGKLHNMISSMVREALSEMRK